MLPGGVGSSARGVRAGWAPYPPFVASGRGSRVTDVDGNEYVDYLMGLGPLLFGHRPPEITAAVVAGVQELGTVFGLPYELEAEAARKVIDAVPSVDMVRFASSGSEAVGTAVRLARAVTDRKLILRFEGHYHGWMDTVYWSNHPDPSAARPAVTAGAGRGRARHAARDRRLARDLVVERPGVVRGGHGGARRSDRGRDHRARDAEHRLHPAGGRLPAAAPRSHARARRAADLR